ncbi:MAG: divalent cation tolerance protein CutA, partial [bacterium]|nr:divalent cation tolerance protein CutA [bacterium]
DPPQLTRTDSLAIEAILQQHGFEAKPTPADIQSRAEEQVAKSQKRRRDILINIGKGLAIIVTLLLLRYIIGFIDRRVRGDSKLVKGIDGSLTIKTQLGDSSEAACVLFITTPSEDQAVALGKTLVDNHLAACANITPPILSMSPTAGTIETRSEVMVIVKTLRGHAKEISKYVKDADRSSDMIIYPIFQGYKPYMDWIQENTRSQPWWKRI